MAVHIDFCLGDTCPCIYLLFSKTRLATILFASRNAILLPHFFSKVPEYYSACLHAYFSLSHEGIQITHLSNHKRLITVGFRTNLHSQVEEERFCVFLGILFKDFIVGIQQAGEVVHCFSKPSLRFFPVSDIVEIAVS